MTFFVKGKKDMHGSQRAQLVGISLGWLRAQKLAEKLLFFYLKEIQCNTMDAILMSNAQCVDVEGAEIFVFKSIDLT
jgi:hypothetical protein